MTQPISSTALRSLDDTVDIETPELTVITYTIAGVGSRVKAAIIDSAVIFGLLLVIVIIAAMVGFDFSFGGWAFAALVLAQFMIIWGYYILCEGLLDGQTLGKRNAGIRVVKDGGYSVSLASAAARNIMRIVDYQPLALPAVGLLTMAFSKSGKRVGDMVAGTIVVREQALPARFGSSGAPVSAALETVQGSAVLTDPEFDVLCRYVERRSALPREQREKLVATLSQRFRDRLPDRSQKGAVLLLELYERESALRRSGRPGRGAKGAERDKYAIVSEGKGRWAAFATRVRSIRRRGIEKLSDDELSGFVADYREIAGDLARLRTAGRGGDLGDVFFLSRIVAAGHNLFYRGGRDELAAFGEFVFRRVPAEVVRSWRPILVAALLFFGPIAVTYSSLRLHPERTEDLVSTAMIRRAEEGVTRAKHGTGYIEDPKEDRPLMGSLIITNNIKVAMLAFAMGVTLIGTPLVLLFNAVSIGAGFALYANKGILQLLLAFVIPHTILELSAITIAGGAGLLLAWAIGVPGRITRGAALNSAAQRSLRLLTCAALFLVFAGMLEGFVSPNPKLSLATKLSFAAASLIAMVLYLSLGRGATALPAPLSRDNG